MGFVFKKLTTGEIVSSNGGLAFRKLSIGTSAPEPSIPGISPDDFDLNWIGLRIGTHVITVTTSAPSLKLAESQHSNPIEYTVK